MRDWPIIFVAACLAGVASLWLWPLPAKIDGELRLAVQQALVVGGGVWLVLALARAFRRRDSNWRD